MHYCYMHIKDASFSVNTAENAATYLVTKEWIITHVYCLITSTYFLQIFSIYSQLVASQLDESGYPTK